MKFLTWFLTPFLFDGVDTGSGGGLPAGSEGAAGTGDTGDGGQPVVTHDPIPWDQHEAVRTKAEKLSWAEKYADPTRVEQATALADWFDRDPVGAHAYVTSILERSGQLQTRQPARQSENQFTDPQTGEPLPDMVVQETGQKLYSAEQMRRHATWQRSEIQKQIDPLRQSDAGRQAEHAAHSIIQEAARSWEGFNDFAPQIYAELQRDRRLSLESAYINVVPKQLRLKNNADLVASTRAKANASTHNPGSQGAISSTEETKLSLSQLMRRELRKRGIGGR